MRVELNTTGYSSADDALPEDVRVLLQGDVQRAIPALARDPKLTGKIEDRARQLATHHTLIRGDSRSLADLPDESLQLALTSPPYWTLKKYADHDAQLGHVEDYEEFLAQLDRVWEHVYRALVPGGRLIIVVGDVCVPRRRFGRHLVFPLHASLQEHCRRLGFDNLNPIIWHKIANAQLEVDGPGGFLGKPYEPNAVIKNDIEFILFQRKPGGYRSVADATRALSVIPEARHREWFQQVWTLPGASTRNHPAPFPLPLAERLVRMFSFVGDTVLDPFTGTGTTNLAAGRWGRHSIGVEVIEEYHELAVERVRELTSQLPFIDPPQTRTTAGP